MASNLQPFSESTKPARQTKAKMNKDASSKKVIQTVPQRGCERKKFEIAKPKLHTVQRVVRNWLGERRYKSRIASTVVCRRTEKITTIVRIMSSSR